jgi:hypothetical protein
MKSFSGHENDFYGLKQQDPKKSFEISAFMLLKGGCRCGAIFAFNGSNGM